MATIEGSITRVYTINLGKAWISPQHRRTNRVVNMIREFARKHMKSDEIKLEQALNREIWSRGKTNPPRKVRVKMVKDEDGVVTVSLYEDLPEATAAATTSENAAATMEKKEVDMTSPAETTVAEQSTQETKSEATNK